MPERPSLAILVPTHGRCAALQALLATIAGQLQEIDDRVTVLVSDNASPDDTAAVVRALQAELPWFSLQLVVQEENLGPIRNVSWLVENAPAVDYVWLFGDDDEPLPGSIAYVLDMLAAQRPAVLHLPHRFDEMGGGGNVDSPCPAVVQRFPTSAELFVAYHAWLSFLSATVVRRSALVEAITAAPTDNPWAPHIWYVVAGRRGPCVVAPRRLVRGGGEAGWLDRAALYLTSHVVDAFEAGFGLVVDAHAFGRALDSRYRETGGVELWNERPLELLIDAVQRFPSSRLLRRALSEDARRTGRGEELAVVDAAVRRAGDAASAERLVADGERQFQHGDLAAAVALFQAAVEEHPMSAEGWCDLGVALHIQGDERAGEAFIRALQADPDHLDALLNHAYWCHEHGLREPATVSARRLLRLAPGHEHAGAILAGTSVG